MTEIERLKQRVEEFGGALIPRDLAGHMFLMLRLDGFKKVMWVAASDSGIRLCLNALDGLEAKATARKVIAEFEHYQEKPWIEMFHSPTDALETAKDVMHEAFDIEEEK